MGVRISFKTSPQRVDWATLDATWALAGQMGGWDGAWMNDHLTDMVADNPGASLEAMTTVATLVHHVPGLRIGHAVLSNTFRHPVITAMGSTVLDHATRGNFVLGLGAGWFEGEHEPFGIDLPPIGPRIDRLVSAVDTINALFTEEAAGPPGVTRDDPFYPLKGAINAPPPLTAGGPPIYLGGQKSRGIALAARTAAGWILPGTHAGNIPYFAEKRDAVVASLESAGRDPATFDIVGQVMTGPDPSTRHEAVTAARGLVAAGATHIVFGMPPSLGPAGLEALVADCLRPLREAAA